jgi:hypothetical protein
VRVRDHQPQATIDLEPEGLADVRWWTLDAMERSSEQFAPPDLAELVRRLTA